MKLSSLLLTFAIVFAVSCQSGEQKSNENVSEDTTLVSSPKEITDMTGVTSYYECPMKCEGKKFAEAGACPVCGMDLVKVELAPAPEESHVHEHDSTHTH